MLAVLDLDPVLRSTGTIGPITPLRNQTLKPELARLAKQGRPDFSLLEIAHEDAIRPARQQAGEIGLAH